MKQVDTIVLVKNIEESKTFYSDILKLEVLHDWQSMVVFKNRLALHQLDLLQPTDLIAPYLDERAIGAGNVIIYVATDNLEAEFARLEALGVEVIHGIVALPWQKIFRMKDNSGYIVEVGEEA